MKVNYPKSGIIDLLSSLEYTYWSHCRMIWSMVLAWPFWAYDLVWGPQHPFAVFFTGMLVYIVTGLAFRMPFFAFVERYKTSYEYTIEIPDEDGVLREETDVPTKDDKGGTNV